jgi:membrane protein involved in colicin uptake
MKLMTGTLAIAIALVTTTGAAFGQNPDAIDNTRSVVKSLQQIQTNQTNAALAPSGQVASPQSAKPVAGSPAKPATGQAAAKPAAPKPAAPAAKSTSAAKAAKPHDAFAPKQKAIVAAKASAHKPASKKLVAASKIPAAEKPATPSATGDAAKAPKPEEKKWAMNGPRDPFFSPVSQGTTTAGCSTGKKCLEIGQINVRGVVKSESGFIAVVTNSLNKAYFLHENDPVFNGYVVKITGDSVVFQETFQDKLGKSLTREVTKKILTPAV